MLMFGKIIIITLIFALAGCYRNIGKQTVEVGTSKDFDAEETTMTNQGQELKIDEVVIGEGAEATNGATVAVHYTGKLTNGTIFDSSINRGTPIEFVLGAGDVIAGWDQGLNGMKVGGKRVLTIPPSLAYGDQGAGGVIPPNSTLIFDVELVEVK